MKTIESMIAGAALALGLGCGDEKKVEVQELVIPEVCVSGTADFYPGGGYAHILCRDEQDRKVRCAYFPGGTECYRLPK